MPPQALDELRNWDGSVSILPLPSLIEVVNMNHMQLLNYLRFCPLSGYFGQSRDSLNEQSMIFNQARKQVIQMIHDGPAPFERLEKISEHAHSEDRGSSR